MVMPVGRLPDIPDPVSPFDDLAPSYWFCSVRRAQGFTAKQIAAEAGINHRTVTAYVERAKERLGHGTVQDLLASIYSVYAPALWVINEQANDDRSGV